MGEKNLLKNKFSLVLLGLSIVTVSCTMYKEMQAVKMPKYEVSKHQGAESCGRCHKEIYNQWSKNSRHSIATTSESFHEMKRKFENDFILNMMMGESMCYACHGPKIVNEGVNCETCHGSTDSSNSIEETHRIKFKPGLKELAKPDFCAICHEMKNPMTGAAILSLYSEWQKSPAAMEGKRCQDCHMRPQERGLKYHGFDSARRNVNIYLDSIDVKDINLNFPKLNLTIENMVKGHAIPASCATRILVLNIDFFNPQGEKVHTITKTFSKKVTLLRGLMPKEIVENDQLQAGELRLMSFTIPSSLQGVADKLILTLRFYEVPDEYLGDLKKANWVSEPFLKKEVRL